MTVNEESWFRIHPGVMDISEPITEKDIKAMAKGLRKLLDALEETTPDRDTAASADLSYKEEMD